MSRLLADVVYHPDQIGIPFGGSTMSDRSWRWAPTPVIILAVVVLAAAGSASAVGIQASDFGDSGAAPYRPLRADAPVGPTDIHNVDTGEDFPFIQDAIDDADTLSGHTLEVRVASHVEGQVVFTKNLTLRGQTGTEVVTPANDTGTTGDNRGWFVVMGGVTVTVEDLTFDGSGFKIHQGWRVKSGAGATFDGVTVQDIQYEPTGPEYAGTCIAAQANITVMNSTIARFGRVGILFFGTEVTNGVAHDNTFTGKGDGDHFDYGVEVGAGATAHVYGNVFTTHGGIVDPTDESSGVNINTVFGPGTVAFVRSNYFTNNHGGITVGFDPDDLSTATVEFNRIVGNAEGFDNRGTSNNVTAENNWWGCNAGPNQTGCDIAVNNTDFTPWLVLSIDANPNLIPVFGNSAVSSDLVVNSNSVDFSGGPWYIPEDTPATFSSTALGSVLPVNDGTVSGQLDTTFTAGGAPGVATVSCTVDNQTVSTTIEIFAEEERAIPMSGPLATGLLLLLLAGAGIWLLRR